jgi:hypothetical protein
MIHAHFGGGSFCRTVRRQKTRPNKKRGPPADDMLRATAALRSCKLEPWTANRILLRVQKIVAASTKLAFCAGSALLGGHFRVV